MAVSTATYIACLPPRKGLVKAAIMIRGSCDAVSRFTYTQLSLTSRWQLRLRERMMLCFWLKTRHSGVC